MARATTRKPWKSITAAKISPKFPVGTLKLTCFEFWDDYKANFEAEKLKENLIALLHDLQKHKPSTSKGVYLKKLTVSSTMGPGVSVDQASLNL